MSTKSVFKMGFLSVIAATGLFGASNGFAADVHTMSNFEGVKANTGMAAQERQATRDIQAVSDDVKVSQTPAPRWQVVDSKGTAYLLTPLQTKDGKASVEYVVPYTMPTSH